MSRDHGLRAASLGAMLLMWMAGAGFAEEPAAAPKPDAPQAAAPEMAGPMPHRGVGQGPCHADAQRLCAEEMGKPTGVTQCLRQHQDELAPACRENMQRRAKWAENSERIRAACGEDAKKLCSGERPGGGRVVSCLRSHESELTDTCREALPSGSSGAKSGS